MTCKRSLPMESKCSSVFFVLGFYFIPGALSIEEQCSWIKASLKSFPQPPNRTNHTAIYGPLRDLLSAVENERVLVQVQNSFGNEAICGDLDESKYIFTEKNSSTVHFEPCKAIPASVLLRKLRWSTLGLQFDWSKVCIEYYQLILFLF